MVFQPYTANLLMSSTESDEKEHIGVKSVEDTSVSRSSVLKAIQITDSIRFSICMNLRCSYLRNLIDIYKIRHIVKC
jgi:hypothetical protein